MSGKQAFQMPARWGKGLNKISFLFCYHHGACAQTFRLLTPFGSAERVRHELITAQAQRGTKAFTPFLFTEGCCCGGVGGKDKSSLAQVNNTNQDRQVVQWAASLEQP